MSCSHEVLRGPGKLAVHPHACVRLAAPCVCSLLSACVAARPRSRVSRNRVIGRGHCHHQGQHGHGAPTESVGNPDSSRTCSVQLQVVGTGAPPLCPAPRPYGPWPKAEPLAVSPLSLQTQREHAGVLCRSLCSDVTIFIPFPFVRPGSANKVRFLESRTPAPAPPLTLDCSVG